MESAVSLYTTDEPKACEFQCETDPDCHGFVVETSFKVRVVLSPTSGQCSDRHEQRQQFHAPLSVVPAWQLALQCIPVVFASVSSPVPCLPGCCDSLQQVCRYYSGVHESMMLLKAAIVFKGRTLYILKVRTLAFRRATDEASCLISCDVTSRVRLDVLLLVSSAYFCALAPTVLLTPRLYGHSLTKRVLFSQDNWEMKGLNHTDAEMEMIVPSPIPRANIDTDHEGSHDF